MAGAAVPLACTSARTVRVEGLEPVLEGIAIAREEERLLTAIGVAIARLVELRERQVRQLHVAAGLLDRSHQRLDHAERHASYGAVLVASEVPTGRGVASRVVGCLEVLARTSAGAERRCALRDLHQLFETFGPAIFEERITYHVGKARTRSLRERFEEWRGAERVA